MCRDFAQLRESRQDILRGSTPLIAGGATDLPRPWWLWLAAAGAPCVARVADARSGVREAFSERIDVRLNRVLKTVQVRACRRRDATCQLDRLESVCS
jgi:hypothetical protein